MKPINTALLFHVALALCLVAAQGSATERPDLRALWQVDTEG